MLVGIVAPAALRFVPYAFFYMGLLEELGIAYEVVVPDRYEGLGDGYGGTLHVLPWDMGRHSLLNYIAYGRGVKRLATGKYDFLIVLATQTGIFCDRWLRKYFDGRYIFDIRDHWREEIPPFYAIEKQVVRHSALNVVSSKKFQTFLPPGEYLPCHNITTPLESLKHRFKKAEGQIIIGYVGSISHEAQCRQLMDLIDRDERFAFHFYGTGPSEAALRAYGEALGNSRIRFFGKYVPSEKRDILHKIDLLFNIYGRGIGYDYALSNKLYDALYYHKPLLTSSGTYMEEMGGELAFSPDLEDPAALNQLWDWYQALEPECMDTFAEQQYSAIVEEQRETGEAIKQILQKQKRKKELGRQ
ncbi:hypothetical protein [uncultured Oscillibacter sp.]|uniref:hypothetical protein n=1 Tax=uncultured Oscillibacter sp. TaxID=876091 RepID=UPI0026381A6C|nr:hypothetical protein [uncultured Oscillibacter sp.]